MKYKVEVGKAKGTIVFIHGNSSSSDVFDDVIKSKILLHTKIAVELPGHGFNQDEDIEDEDVSLMSYRNKLIALINNIDDDVLLVGNSLGGHLAIEIAKDIERLKGLVVFGTPPLKKPLNLEEAFLPIEALQTFLTENPTDIEIESAINQAVYNKDFVPKLIEAFKQTNPKVRKVFIKDVTENKFLNQYAIFTNLKVPKFIIAGIQDPSVNFEYLEMIKNDSVKPCELIKFNECGHYPSIEKPKEFINSLKSIVLKTFI